jgi:hypothetical protein
MAYLFGELGLSRLGAFLRHLLRVCLVLVSWFLFWFVVGKCVDVIAMVFWFVPSLTCGWFGRCIKAVAVFVGEDHGAVIVGIVGKVAASSITSSS